MFAPKVCKLKDVMSSLWIKEPCSIYKEAKKINLQQQETGQN